MPTQSRAVLTRSAGPPVKSRTVMKRTGAPAAHPHTAAPPRMKTGSPALSGLLSAQGALLIESRLLEQLADLMHDTAFFIKDASGCYLMVNQSLVERHGLADKAQMIG